MDVRLPDGTIIKNVPDGTTKADLVAKLQGNGMAVPAEWLQAAPQQPATQEAGQSLNRGLSDIPRQLGLTARYALEGPAQAAQIVTEPIAGLMRMGGIKTKPLGEVASGLADTFGLPKPESSQERVVGDATRMLAGSGATLGAAGAASAFPGMVGKSGAFLAANPLQQATASVGAGGMGGLSREGGGTPLQQAAASVVGGVAGGMVPGLAQGAVNAGRRFLPGSPQALDVQIERIMAQTGLDYSQVPERVRQSLRKELKSSLQAGKELDPSAVRRLADFQAVGATPTRGMVSQNPVQITREMNLAKMGANSSDGQLQGLAQLQGRNNTRLIDAMNESGAGRGDMYQAGQQAIGGIASRDATMAGAKDAAYAQLKAMPGYREAPIAPNAISSINKALDAEDAVMYLPKEISSYMESFLQPGAPAFTVSKYENLQKMLSNAATSADGNVRWAAGTAKRALESAPVTAANQVPGAASAGTATAASEAIGQLQAARGLHRDWRSWQESAQPIKAAVNGMEPDKFVQKFVLGGTVADASAVAQNAPKEAVKEAILAHLKDKALNGSADEIGKFSQSAFNKAMGQIGDRKLALFFSPEELSQIKTIGRVASYMQNQPVGSAVNNSNSGALLLGKGLDAMNKIPIIGPNIGKPLQDIRISMQQRAAQNVMPGLLAATEKAPLYRGLLNPAIGMGGLLAAPMPN